MYCLFFGKPMSSRLLLFVENGTIKKILVLSDTTELKFFN